MSFSVTDAAADAGSEPALVIDGEAISFSTLERQVAPARLALRSLVPPDHHARSASEIVALRAAPRLGTLLAVYALLEEGIPFVPIHPRLAAVEAEQLVADLSIEHTLDIATLASFEEKSLETMSIDKYRVDGDRTLAVMFTSGTSGKSRGAILSRSAFEASARASAANLPWRPNDRWLLCMPLAHVGGLSIVTRCLHGRQAVVFHSKFDVEAVLRSIGSEGITRVSLVPTMLFDLLASDRDNLLAKLDTVLLGGAATAPALLEECARRNIRALTTYGLTEACSQVTTQAPRDPGSVVLGSGRPLAGVEMQITRADGSGCEPGEIGSISIRGASLMRGYVGEAPIANSFFDTGDMGSFDENGALHLASRKKDLIISGGENVYPLEVEAALLACEGVEGAVVFGAPDARWGEQVAAVIVAGSTFDEERAHVQLRRSLAAFKLPRALVIARELPKSEGGKIARAEVVRLFTSSLRPWRSS